MALRTITWKVVGKAPAAPRDFTAFYSLVNVHVVLRVGARVRGTDVTSLKITEKNAKKKSILHLHHLTFYCTKLCQPSGEAQSPYMGVWLQQPQQSVKATQPGAIMCGSITVCVSASCWPPWWGLGLVPVQNRPTSFGSKSGLFLCYR